MYTVFGDILSGNCYKVKLVLARLGIDHHWVHVDILNGESQTPEFLAMNPLGEIPVLRLPDGGHLTQSNAILHYLAEGSTLLPEGRLERATVLQWLFFEQYSHEPYIAVARYIAKYLGLPAAREAEYQAKQAGGRRALAVMEGRLADHDYLVGDHLTIADLGLYAYTHVAHEGGFDLGTFPAVQRWLERVAEGPGHVTMEQFVDHPARL